MKRTLLLGALSLVAARSRRLRKFTPLMPVAVALYDLVKHQRRRDRGHIVAA